MAGHGQESNGIVYREDRIERPRRCGRTRTGSNLFNCVQGRQEREAKTMWQDTDRKVT